MNCSTSKSRISYADALAHILGWYKRFQVRLLEPLLVNKPFPRYGTPFLLLLILFMSGLFISGLISEPVLSAPQPSSNSVSWLYDLPNGVKESTKRKKWLLVIAGANWCPDCRRLESSVLPAKSVQTFLSGYYVCVKLDSDRSDGQALISRYNVKGIPAIFVFTPEGQYISHASAEHVDPTSFIAMVSNLTRAAYSQHR